MLHAVSTYDAKRRRFGREGKSFCLVAVRPLGNSFSLSAAPSRGSHVLRDSCSREILSATGLFSSRATLTVRLKGSLARELAAVDAVTACSA